MIEAILFQYGKEDSDLEDFKSVFKEDSFVFYTISYNQQLSAEYFDMIKNDINIMTNKMVLMIEDVDIQWKKWDRITRSIILLIGQSKKIGLFKFSVNSIDQENKKLIFFFNIWGNSPLPSKEQIFEDAKQKIKTL